MILAISLDFFSTAVSSAEALIYNKKWCAMHGNCGFSKCFKRAARSITDRASTTVLRQYGIAECGDSSVSFMICTLSAGL